MVLQALFADGLVGKEPTAPQNTPNQSRRQKGAHL